MDGGATRPNKTTTRAILSAGQANDILIYIERESERETFDV